MSEEKNKNSLAIVIPAYKLDFLNETLESISMQTCKDFKLYIGDDNSPYDLKSIVDKFVNLISIEYKRFDTNLGKNDLVAHWERCIGMTKEEPWVWLFSDDDIMSKECVEMFYKTQKIYPKFDLYKLNLEQIDESGNKLNLIKDNVSLHNVEDLILGRLRSTLQITIIDYIFRKDKFLEVGGFQKFDLAWGSDDATWIKIGKEKGIVRIESGAKVFWRRSFQNISSLKSRNIVYRKMNARIDYSSWLITQARLENISINSKILKREIYKWLSGYFENSCSTLGIYDLVKLQIRVFEELKSFFSVFLLVRVGFFKTKSMIKYLLKY